MITVGAAQATRDDATTQVRGAGGAGIGDLAYRLGDHIDIGFGRDYDEVAPVAGMLRLEGRQASSHSVDIEESPVQDPRALWSPLGPPGAGPELGTRPRPVMPPPAGEG